jgi:hypothetical protein
MNAPLRFKLECPWCPFYVDAAQESGAGEAAATMMQEHASMAHDRTWQEWLQATAREDGAPQP